MKYIILFLGLFTIASTSFYAQQSKFKRKFLKPINATDLKNNVYILASDSLNGRETGSPGQKKAAKYISDYFSSLQLTPLNDTTYFQTFELGTIKWQGYSLIHQKDTFAGFKQFIHYNSHTPFADTLKLDLVFAGNGSEEILKELSIQDKAVFVILSTLDELSVSSRLAKNMGATKLFWSQRGNQEAFKEAKKVYGPQRRRSIRIQDLQNSDTTFSTFITQPQLCSSLFTRPFSNLEKMTSLDSIKTVKSTNIKLFSPIKKLAKPTENVIAYIPGSGNQNESIVITAHYDHVGANRRGIYYGADDNASGTSVLLELAKTFSQLSKPCDKNLIFIATSGEEKGLLGAHYFSDHPEQHRFEIKANINIDMIGRTDSTHKDNYVYLLGSREYPKLDSICHLANSLIKEPLALQYDYEDKEIYGNLIERCDLYAFHKKNIPSLGFFSGLHKDYHKTTDTPDKLNYELMEKRAKLIFTMIYLIANDVD